jgi:hypothetical protein
MTMILYIFLTCVTAVTLTSVHEQERTEIKIVQELFRLRNEHKADSAELLYADTVLVYMKYLRNIPKKIITQSDKKFWKAHPKNKFEITAPVQITTKEGLVTAIIIGKEYLDGAAFQYEKIEIRFDREKKINYFRGIKWKKVE